MAAGFAGRFFSLQRLANDHIAIDREYHNLWVMDWLTEEDGHRHLLHLAPILVDYWVARSYPLDESIQLIRAALPFAVDDSQKAHNYIYLGRLK